MSRTRRVGEPRPIRVETDDHGRPRTVAGAPVESIREEWLVKDRWWTDEPLARRYFELVLAGGPNLTVFWDLETGSWLSQRA